MNTRANKKINFAITIFVVLTLTFLSLANVVYAFQEPALDWTYKYELTNIGTSYYRYEDALRFIAEYDIGHSVDTSKLQVGYAKSGFEVVETGNPLEVRQAIGKEKGMALHIQWYENGQCIIYIAPFKGSNGEPKDKIFVDALYNRHLTHSDDYIRNPIEDSGFSYSDISEIVDLKNWIWYSREPGIWTLVCINSEDKEASFNLAKNPKYFYSGGSGGRIGDSGPVDYINGVKTRGMSPNYKDHVFDGYNYIKGRSKTLAFLVSSKVNSIEPNSYFKFEIDTNYINDFWAKHESKEAPIPTPKISISTPTPTLTVTPPPGEPGSSFDNPDQEQKSNLISGPWNYLYGRSVLTECEIQNTEIVFYEKAGIIKVCIRALSPEVHGIIESGSISMSIREEYDLDYFTGLAYGIRAEGPYQYLNSGMNKIEKSALFLSGFIPGIGPGFGIVQYVNDMKDPNEFDWYEQWDMTLDSSQPCMYIARDYFESNEALNTRDIAVIPWYKPIYVLPFSEVVVYPPALPVQGYQSDNIAFRVEYTVSSCLDNKGMLIPEKKIRLDVLIPIEIGYTDDWTRDCFVEEIRDPEEVETVEEIIEEITATPKPTP